MKLLLLLALLGAKIDGPATTNVGQAVILSAPNATPQRLAWFVTGSNVVSLEDGSRLIVGASAACRVEILLAESVDGGKPLVSRHVLQVGSAPGPGPVPPLPPDPAPPTPPSPPAPPPAPDLPPGKYGLALFARDLALSQVSDSPARLRGAKALAPSFRSMASAIAAGTVSGTATILKATKQANDTALGVDQQAFVPWGDALGKRCQEFNAAGSLRTSEDFAVAWREVALGLEAVR